MSRTDNMPDLSQAADTALDKFQRDWERAQTATDGFRKAAARDAVEQAKASLRPREWAIIDFCVIRGQSITDVARKTKLPTDEISELFRTAADALADHYERAGASS